LHVPTAFALPLQQFDPPPWSDFPLAMHPQTPDAFAVPAQQSDAEPLSGDP